MRRSGTLKKIALTGCTGSVGRELVRHLEARGVELLLLGRDPKKIEIIFPGREICDYASLQERGADYDLLAHLATLNNGIEASEAEFTSVNVSFAHYVARQAGQGGIRRFVYFSSFHALDARRKDFYAQSKRTATSALRELDSIDVLNLYLPAVYGQRWSGKMGWLNLLPASLANILFPALAALRPTVHVSRIAEFLIRDEKDYPAGDVLLADDQDHNQFYKLGARLIDLAFALTVLALLGWFLAILWVLVRLESRGPGIFAQRRVGQGGRTFTCYKFRTMHVGTPQLGTHEVTVASVTRMGRFLRTTKLDELPQIFNILRNDISLVGPRPCLPVQEELVARRRALGVLTMKPGITGLAQVNNVDMSDPERLAAIDARYKMVRSLPLNLRIIFSTFLGRGRGDKIGR